MKDGRDNWKVFSNDMLRIPLPQNEVQGALGGPAGKGSHWSFIRFGQAEYLSRALETLRPGAATFNTDSATVSGAHG